MSVTDFGLNLREESERALGSQGHAPELFEHLAVQDDLISVVVAEQRVAGALEVENVIIGRIAELEHGEVSPQATMQTCGEGHYFDGYRRFAGHVYELLDLLFPDSFVPHYVPDHGLVEDEVQSWRLGLFEEVLPRHSYLYSRLNRLRGEITLIFRDDSVGVFFGLQESGHEITLVVPYNGGGGFVFQILEKDRWNTAPEPAPPRGLPRCPGQIHQLLNSGSVVN